MKVETEIKEHFLFPCTIFTNREPYRVQTILGSCVAVCLYDIKLGFGGINHYMLPWWNGNGTPSPKYGDIATTKLIDKMCALGSRPESMVAKIFGGANQFSITKSVFDIGKRNIDTAVKILGDNNINIIAHNTGGEKGRKIVFNTLDNKVLMKFLEGNDISLTP